MHIRLLIFLVVGGFLFVTDQAQAATLYMEPRGVEINRGDTIAVAVRVDTDEDECINVVDGVIRYSDNIEPVDTTRGNSIMSVWVEDPVIDKQNKTITFAGGIPNGYCGRIPGDPRLSNIIIELLFRSPGMVIGGGNDNGVAEITFDPQTQVLLNDGFGTAAPLATYGTSINLSDSVGAQLTNEWSDRVEADELPPEEFVIKLLQTPNAFSGKYYIVFNTTDKQSGLDHYEVIEEPLEQQNLFLWGAEDAPWVEARSPYVLKDQSLNSTIRVRAFDKAGNFYIANLVPEESQRGLSTQGKIMIALIVTVLIVFVLAGLVAWFLYMRRRNKTPLVENEITEFDDGESNQDEV